MDSDSNFASEARQTSYPPWNIDFGNGLKATRTELPPTTFNGERMISFYLTNGDCKIKIETSQFNGSKFKAFFHLIQRNLPQTAQPDSPKRKQPKLEAHDFSAQTDSFQIPSTSPDLSPQLNALNQKLVSLQEQIFQLHQTQHPPSWADIASRTPSPQLKTINRYDSTLIFDNVPIQHDSTEHFVQLINETLATNAILPPITSSEVTSILKLQKPLAWTVSFSTVNLAKSVLASSKHFRSPSRTHRIFISPMLSPQQQQKMEDLVSKFKLLRKKISERSYDFRVYQCGLAVKIVSANGNKVFYPAGSKTAPYDFITEHKASLRT